MDKEQIIKLLKVAKCPACNGGGTIQVSEDDFEQCQWCDERDKIINQPKTPITDIKNLLPTLEEVEKAAKEIGKESTAPDKDTPNWMERDIKNGINWALNYIVNHIKQMEE